MSGGSILPEPSPDRATRPLRGIRVLDLTNVLSGPFCTYQLGLLDAEIIKVETPGSGDLARQLGADPALNKALMGASFIAQNAGKKSMTINLKSSNGRAILEKLVCTADVLVENFRPGVMKRLELSYDRLASINPGLVYCAISGFGQSGPLAQNPAYDQIIQGLSGVMSITGDVKSAPLRVGFPVSDSLGGLTAAFAIAAALVGRAKSGKGRFIDVSMLDATLVSLGWIVSNYLTAGLVPSVMGNENMTAAPSGTFETADGLLNIAANKQEQFECLCKLIDRPDIIVDARFAERDSRKRNRAELKTEIERILRTRSASYWEQAFNESGIPAGRVLSVPEALDSPQVRHRRLVQDLAHNPRIKTPIRVVTAGFSFDDGELSAGGPPPALGEHTEEVLESLGYDTADVARLRREGAV